jgi:tetratricopeptide (TPR) repeat protein
LTRQTAEALVEAERVLNQVPSNTDALTARAEANLQLKKYDESKEDFSRLFELQPSNPFFIHRLGTIEALQGNSAQALSHFRSALKINPNLADVINDIVYIYFSKGDQAGALSELNRLMENSDAKEIYHLYKGRIHVGREEYTEAEREFRNAIELNPKYYQAYLMLGQLNVMKGDLDQAIEEVDALIGQQPDFSPAYLLKAYYYDAAKRPARAIRFYRRTLELDPKNHIAANNLAWLLAKDENTRIEARTLAETARQMDPKNTHYADTLGWIYYLTGQYSLAVDQLLFAVNEGNPPSAANFYRLGMAYYKRGDLLKAKQSLRTALSMNQEFEGIDEAKRTLSELG